MSAPHTAFVLAAGRGERMRPLTESTPKPLLRVGGMRLIEWHLHALARAGVREAVINIAHLSSQFAAALHDGKAYGLRVRYSDEGAQALETGGGMLHALALLGDAPFLGVNGDIWCDFDFATLPSMPEGMAHLVLVDNPAQHPGGDFWLGADGRVHGCAERPEPDARRLTFSGIGVYRPSVLEDWRATIGDTPGARLTPPRFPLAPLLRTAMARGAVSGTHHRGRWFDVGTPQRLHELDAMLRAQASNRGPIGG
jgi:MurNAc alpha-1-phosphate uridylyltransferase